MKSNKSNQRDQAAMQKRLNQILPELQKRLQSVYDELFNTTKTDNPKSTNAAIYGLFGIGRESFRSLRTPKIRFRTLETMRRGNHLSDELKAKLMLEEVCAFVRGETNTNPFTKIAYILEPVPLPSRDYKERPDCARQFQDFLHHGARKVLNVHGVQGCGLTQFVAFQLKKFVGSACAHALFPDGVGYYNVNPANNQDHQTRRSVPANTAQRLMALFKLPENEAGQNVAIRQFLRNKQLLLVMENVPDEAYAEKFVHWLDDSHLGAKIVLISVKRLDLHETDHLNLRPFNEQEALQFIQRRAPFLQAELEKVKVHTGFRPKYLSTFCHLARLEQKTAREDYLKPTIDSFSDRLRSGLESHHAASLSGKDCEELAELTVSRRPMVPERAAAIWDCSPDEAQALLRRFVKEVWLTRTKDSAGSFSFNFIEREMAAGFLFQPEYREKARQARINLARFMATESAEIEQAWAGGGEKALRALKEFLELKEDFWWTLHNLGEDGLRHEQSADAFLELFGSCPETMFQMFTFSERGELAARAMELARKFSTKFCDRGVYVARWFTGFEQYLLDNFLTSLAAAQERVELARRLKEPSLLFFALCEVTRNKVKLACEYDTPDDRALEAWQEAEQLVKSERLPARYKCYCDFYEGWAAYHLKNYTQSEACLLKARVLARKAPFYPLLGRILIMLSRLSRKRNEIAQAETFGLEAMTFARSSQQNEIAALAARNLSRVYEAKGDYAEAAKHEERWHQWKVDQKHPTACATCDRLAKLLQRAKPVEMTVMSSSTAAITHNLHPEI